MTKQDDDSQLIQRTLSGDQAAFAPLMQKHERRIKALIQRYIQDPAIVADIKQDVFEIAYKNLATFRGHSTFYTWLHRIACNQALSYLKKPYLSYDKRTVGGVSDDVQSADAVDLNSQNPGVTHDCVVAQGIITEAISDLAEPMRVALVMYDLINLSYQDIAELMQCPEGTVRSRVARGRAYVIKQLSLWRNS